MTNKLVQKHLVKGTQAFEIVDDMINITIKAPFKKEETLSVMLAVLNPEPEIGKSCLEFTSRVNNEALFSLYLAKPNAKEFNAFVNLLKQKVQDEYKAFAGLKKEASPILNGNVYDAPPEFDTAEKTAPPEQWEPVDVEGIESSIRMLRDYVGGEEINPLLTALENLMAEPENIELRQNVFKQFDALGATQGAVLTYAPYVGILMSGDPYDNF